MLDCNLIRQTIGPWLFVFAFPVVAAGQLAPPVIVVDDFDGGLQNRVGGYRNVFQRSPSVASGMRVEDVFRGESGKSLLLSADRKPTGFCGYWLHLFHFHDDQPKFFDASSYRFLSFWVKGTQGGESFLVRLADREWVRKEDSVSLGDVRQWLKRGVTTEWQEVIVPLSGPLGLDLSQLGAVTFEFASQGVNVVYIDDVAFKSHAWVKTPKSPPISEEDVIREFLAVDVAGASQAASQPVNKSSPPTRAMWVWSTKSFLNNEPAQQELFAFCRREQIGVLWMQLLYSVATTDDKTLCEVQQPDEVRQLLQAAHAAGLRVHALEGYPEFCQRESHHIPLAIVDGVRAFNAAGKPSERYDGVHFDNEPHLLVGWQHEPTRERILTEFLELNAECQRRASAAGIEFGIDIPFWWQEKNLATGRPNGEVTFRGRKAPASFHCLDLLDNVGVMNYRDAADGADGLIYHGRELLAYADRQGRAKVFMGIETFHEPALSVWFVRGVPRSKYQASLSGSRADLGRLSRLNNLRLRTFDDGECVHVGVEIPAGEDLASPVVHEAMQQLLTHDFGGENGRDSGGETNRLATAKKAFESDPEWRGFRRHDIPLDGSDRLIPGFVVQAEMLSKITFGDNSARDFRQQTAAAETFFKQHRQYGGLAIHFYETFRKVVDGK